MLPTIAQQLQAIKFRMEETIIPAILADEVFAHEQADLIVATIDWLLDTHEHQYCYEAAENLDYRELLSELVIDAQAISTEEGIIDATNEILSEVGPPPVDELIPLRSIINQNRRLKGLSEKLFNSICLNADQEVTKRTKTRLSKVAENQVKRELAFFRMTGYLNDAIELEKVLSNQVKNIDSDNE